MRAIRLFVYCIAALPLLCACGEAAEETVEDEALHRRLPEVFAVSTPGGAPVGWPIFADASHVFWFDETGGYLFPEGPIYIRSKAAFAAPRVLVAGTWVSSLYSKRYASDGTSFYYIDYTIHKVAKSGGLPIALTTTTAAGNVAAIALDANHVYWSNGTSVQRVSKNGGAPETIVTGDSIAAPIAVDEGSLYFADEMQATIARVAKDGSGSPATLVSGVRGIGDLEVDATSIFWSVPSEGIVATTWKSFGGAATVLADDDPSPDGWNLGDLAVDGLNVYFERAGTNRLVAVSKWTRLATELARPATPGFIAVDGTHVYWSEDAGVMRVRK